MTFILEIFISVVLFFLAGCSTMQGITEIARTAGELTTDVKNDENLVHKGKLKRIEYVGEKTSFVFKDGTSYAVNEHEYQIQVGRVVRIYKTKDGYWARQFILDEGSAVAQGRVQRLEFLSDTTILHLDDGQSYEVDGDVRAQVGTLVTVYRDEFGFSAKPD